MDQKPVEVLHAGRWWPGWVRDQRRELDGRWRALVTYTVAPSASYYQWQPGTLTWTTFFDAALAGFATTLSAALPAYRNWVRLRSFHQGAGRARPTASTSDSDSPTARSSQAGVSRSSRRPGAPLRERTRAKSSDRTA